MPSIFWALLVLFLFGALLRMDWVYYLAYVVGGVWLFSTWAVRRSLARVRVTRVLLDRAFIGQQIGVSVKIENQSRIPLPWLKLDERVPLDIKDLAQYSVALSVGGRDRVDHKYTLAAKRRGYFPLGPLSLRTGDLFGFAEARWEEASPPHLTVYPLIVPLARLGLPSRLPIGALASTQRLYEDPARLSGVRAYAAGDSQRRIHWKASAHTGALLVKKFQPAIGLNVMIALDFDRASYGARHVVSGSEWAATIAASVAAAVAQQRQPVGLLCLATDAASNGPAAALPPRAGQGQLMALLSTLARAQLREPPADGQAGANNGASAGAAPAFSEWLTPQLAGQEWGTTIVAVTPHVTDDLLWVLHQAYRRGSSIMLLHSGDQADSRMLAPRASRLGIGYHLVLWDRDLEALA